jgi:hypothetical protein
MSESSTGGVGCLLTVFAVTAPATTVSVSGRAIGARGAGRDALFGLADRDDADAE